MNLSRKPSIQHVGIFVLIAISYIVLGELGLRFASVHPSISAIWPSTGLAIASLLVFGSMFWPAIFIGAFLIHCTSLSMILPSIGIAVGHTLEAVIAVYLVKRFANGIRAFDLPRNTVLYVLWAGVVSTLISALLGVTTLLLFHLLAREVFINAFVTWWLGGMSGAIIIAPLIILWTLDPRIQLHRTKTPEFLLLLLVLFATGMIVFSSSFPFPYLFFVPVIWCAFRFNLRETITIIFLISLLSVRATVIGIGPFADAAYNQAQALLFLQIFLVTLTLTKLTVASLVTDRQRTYGALSLRERFFKALIEKNTDAVCLINREGVISYASPSAYFVLGYLPEEVIGKSSISFIHPEEQETAKKLLMELVTTPESLTNHIYRMRAKDGSYKWIETIGRSLLSDPAVRAVIINFRDISERKALEEAKNEFFMIAAHQLRSPLTSIRWHLESALGQKSSFTPELTQKLLRIQEGSQIMIRTVNEILDVTRIIEGKLATSPERIDISDILHKQAKEFEHLAHTKGIALTIEDQGAPVQTTIDPKLFSAVVENILSNAIKYTKHGSITISTELQNNEIVVTVADTGVGIPKEEQSQLFTKFFRTKEARMIDAEGAGLGLFIVKSYVTSWGGTVRVNSPTIGTTGTTVTFTIPTSRTT